MNLFDNDISLTCSGDSLLKGNISDNWSINGIPNGGYLLAMLANAMLQKSDKKGTPIVTANYLSRCTPGDAEIITSEIVSSNHISRFESRMFQEGKEKIRALGTFFSEEIECNINRYESNAPVLAPIDECIQVPRIPKYTLYDNLDLRLDPDCTGWMSGKLTYISENKGYFKFKDDRPFDLLCLFLIIDAIPPAVFATQGISAWVPTIEISVNIRNLPQSKWLKCSLKTRFITCGLLEADGEIWDEGGNLAAISRQIAQFRKG